MKAQNRRQAELTDLDIFGSEMRGDVLKAAKETKGKKAEIWVLSLGEQ